MFKIKRRKTRTVKIGNIKIGSGHPVAIQSMVKVRASDVEASVVQINDLQRAGCEIVRIAVEDLKDASAIAAIKRKTRLPLVADIHFDHRLALASIESGVDKIRLNPGNIYKESHVRSVIDAAKQAHIPIRIGANSGSLRTRSSDTAGALVKSVQEYLKVFKRMKFHDIVISLKGSGILETIYAYKKMARVCDYSFHLGVTATGLPLDGVVKSSAGMGVLLFAGIGDTIRVSLLEQPSEEVRVAQLLLASLGLRTFGPQLVCCPTCGRCEVDLSAKAHRFEALLSQLSNSEKELLKNTKIALMGCVVNGPGEARDAEAGIAFSRHKGILFEKGQIVKTVGLASGEKELFNQLKKVIKKNRR
ncbi:MAG: flavodoxin-dependent (E)-4-hydroxy-3-methylbut-2-enyl-diphosphate synthase [Candidatus Omnitrophica bacterium]|nr:flavodoxin-dependent (E)-4-hydroxy-3-methylbut-2-enyl-diphosphate synthase [Candidatus Omnitrophota bacterium]